MNSRIKKIVDTSEIDIIGSDDFLNPFATRASLVVEQDDCLVEINVDALTIECNLWVGETQYHPSNDEVDYFYSVISREIVKYNDNIKEARYHDYFNQDETFYIN